MKRNSDLRNTCSSCVMQMLKWQTRVKGAVNYQILRLKTEFSTNFDYFSIDEQLKFHVQLSSKKV